MTKKQSMGDMMGDLEPKVQPQVVYTKPRHKLFDNINVKKFLTITFGATTALATAAVIGYLGYNLVSSIDFGTIDFSRPTQQELPVEPTKTKTLETIVATSTPIPEDICSNSNYNCEPITWDISLPTISSYLVIPVPITGYAASDRKLKVHYEILEPSTYYTDTYGTVNLCHLPENISFTISGPGVSDSIPGANSSKFTTSGHTSYEVEIDTSKGGDYKILLKNYEFGWECPNAQVILTISEGIWSK